MKDPKDFSRNIDRFKTLPSGEVRVIRSNKRAIAVNKWWEKKRRKPREKKYDQK